MLTGLESFLDMGIDWPTLDFSFCSQFFSFLFFFSLNNSSHGLGRVNLLSFSIKKNLLGLFVVLKLIIFTNDLMGIGLVGFIFFAIFACILIGST